MRLMGSGTYDLMCLLSSERFAIRTHVTNPRTNDPPKNAKRIMISSGKRTKREKIKSISERPTPVMIKKVFIFIPPL
jgi:hypothetical protein